MKKTLLFVALIAKMGFASAQWTSPGNGTNYSMSDLVAASDGCVQLVETGTFRIVNDLTISANDGLSIADSESIIYVNDQVTVTIQGSFNCAAHESFVEIKTENEEHYNLRLENATDCHLNGIKFKYGGGFQLIESDVVFENCFFVHFNTQANNAAVNYMNCSPVFKGCTFKNNDGAAIASGINVNGSPVIMDCTFSNNVITNQNLPQINLGPGAEDTIRIVNNSIVGGHYSMSGGIAISDLMGTGSTKVLLKGNEIRDNRYGYNQQGMVISSLIVDNQFINNDAELDAMNGGSGISIYGYSADMKAKLRRNVISGNLWGITGIYYHDIDLGTEDDFGYNSIYGNYNDAYGIEAEYAIYNNAVSDISAVGNYWGYDSEAEVENVIFHRPDLDETYGLVTYLPFLDGDPQSVDYYEEQPIVKVFPNPNNGTFVVESDLDEAEYSIYNMMGQVVCTNFIKSGQSQVSLPEIGNGVYFIKIDAKDAHSVQRIVVSR